MGKNNKPKVECKDPECLHSLHWHDKFGCLKGACTCRNFVIWYETKSWSQPQKFAWGYNTNYNDVCWFISSINSSNFLWIWRKYNHCYWIWFGTFSWRNNYAKGSFKNNKWLSSLFIVDILLWWGKKRKISWLDC